MEQIHVLRCKMSDGFFLNLTVFITAKLSKFSEV